MAQPAEVYLKAPDVIEEDIDINASGQLGQ